jgi:hypothetical protein
MVDITKNEIPVYKFTGETARDNGELEGYRISYRLNVECGEAIDKAIIDNSKPGPAAGTQYIDTEKAARSVVAEYGAERVAWVVAGNVNNHDFDGRLSNANKTWAKDFDTAKPDVHLKAHMSVLDTFVGKVREIEKEKPSLMTALDKGEKKSKAEFSDKVQPSADAPDKTVRKNNEER